MLVTRPDEPGTQGRRYAHNTRVCRSRIMRDLRDNGRVFGGGSLGAGRSAAHPNAGRHPKDFITHRWAYEGLRDDSHGVSIDPGNTVARHTHPGVESSYVREGTVDNLPIEGQAT